MSEPVEKIVLFIVTYGPSYGIQIVKVFKKNDEKTFRRAKKIANLETKRTKVRHYAARKWMED